MGSTINKQLSGFNLFDDPAKLTGMLSDPTGGVIQSGIIAKDNAEFWGGEFSDTFMPDMPDPEVPAPVAQESTLAAAQAERRSLINRAGLDTTKKVRTLLGRNQTLGS